MFLPSIQTYKKVDFDQFVEQAGFQNTPPFQNIYVYETATLDINIDKAMQTDQNKN